MMRWRLARLFPWLGRRRADAEIQKELDLHLELETQQNVERGMSRAEAARAARLTLGNTPLIREDAPAVWGWRWVDDATQDVRYGVRALGKQPAFAVTAVLTVALTLGAVSTVLTLMNTFFFQPLPVERPDELVAVTATRNPGRTLGYVSYPDYVHFRDRTRTIKDLAAHYSTAPLFVRARDEGREINGAVVSANLFPVLGVQPTLGRLFRPEEDQVPGRDPVVVLGHDFWNRTFDGSSDAVGAAITINGVVFTVVGVAPPTFQGLSPRPAQIYLPMMMLGVGYRACPDAFADECTSLDMIGRLADGQTLAEASAELETLVPARWAEAPDGYNSGVTVFFPRGISRGEEGQFVTVLAIVAGLLLLVCCANLAGLLAARGTSRGRELALRTALGATRRRLVRQLLTESVLLALVGGVFGVVVSVGMMRVLDIMFFTADYAGRPLSFDFTLRPVVLVAVISLCVVTGVVFGWLPALRSIRVGSAQGLTHQSSTMSARSPIGRWLVGIQSATAVALIAVAALLTASARLLVNGTNFDPSRVALLRLRPGLVAYTPQRAQQFHRAVVDRLRAAPEVESVSMVGTGGALQGFEVSMSLPDWAPSRVDASRVGYIEVSDGYFNTLRIPLLRGRDFDDRDLATAPPVAIVSQALATGLWPDGEAIGAMIGVGSTSNFSGAIADHQPHRVIGVVEDVSLQPRSEPLKPYVYLPYWQNPGHVDARLQVRVAGDPAEMLPALVREVSRIDPNVPVADTVPLPVNLAGRFRPLRMNATFVAYASGLALLLSAIGLYGIQAFTVSRRTKEIGIRLAVGAAPNRIMAMVVREGMTVTLLGVIVGLGLALTSTRFVQHLLYAAVDRDAVFFVVAGMLVAAVGFLASYVPARRAARVDPTTALKVE